MSVKPKHTTTKKRHGADVRHDLRNQQARETELEAVDFKRLWNGRARG